MTCNRKLATLTVLSSVIVLVIALATGANAAIIIDPGNIGDTFSSRSASFNDLNGTTFSGQVLELDFVFDAMKHVEVIGTSTDSYGIGVSLSHTAGGSTFVVAFPPFSDLFLSDENGDPVAGPNQWSQNSPGDTVGFIMRFASSDVPNGLIYHDIHASIALPSSGETITGGTVSWIDTGYTNEVGEWMIPEPATLALAGVGLLSVSACRRRRG